MDETEVEIRGLRDEVEWSYAIESAAATVEERGGTGSLVGAAGGPMEMCEDEFLERTEVVSESEQCLNSVLMPEFWWPH
jgi:hypothetical protein